MRLSFVVEGREREVDWLSGTDDFRVVYAARLAQLEEASRTVFADLFEPRKLLSAAAIRCGFLAAIVVARADGAGQEEMSLYYGFDARGRRVAVVTVRDVTVLHSGAALEGEIQRRTVEALTKLFATIPQTSINDMVELSQLGDARFDVCLKPHSVPNLVQEVVDAFRAEGLPGGVVFNQELDEMPWLNLDAHLFQLLLRHLLSNAFKFTVRGGVTLRVHWREGVLSVVVEDTGAGIAEADLDRIRLPLVKGSAGVSRPGAGLGLAICQQIVTRLGGDMTIQSTDGHGSIFTCTLPRVEAAFEKDPAALDAGAVVCLGEAARGALRELLVGLR